MAVPPKQSAASRGGTNGILSVPGSAIRKSSPSQGTIKKSSPRAAAPRLKLVVRRLPPGLTSTEFEASLGAEWLLQGGKVDWYLYKDGKVSTDPSKPSRPARAYLRVTSQDHIASLANKVRQTDFHDSKNSSRDVVLLGPPSLEFAPYGRIPGSRVRKDGRQGTIDQDPEFIEFLESLTNPIAKPTTVDQEAEAAAKKDEKVTTTPLVQFLKEKKANKGKESAAAARATKQARQETKENKGDKAANKKLLNRPEKDAAPSSEKQGGRKVQVEKVTNEAVKVLNKQAASLTAQSTATAKPSLTTKESTTLSPPAEKKRERGNASAAAKILQRDLGLSAPSGSRKRTLKTTPAAETVKAGQQTNTISAGGSKAESQPTSKAPTTASPSPSLKPVTTEAPAPIQAPPPKGPAAMRQPSAKPSAPTPLASTKTSSSSPTTPVATSTGTQAFLKHANASQGITESLLQSAFTPFGTVLKVEIDKKKGFGYVDFAEPEGLKNAMEASPVKVAQGQVVVLERKTPGSGTTRQSGKGAAGENVKQGGRGGVAAQPGRGGGGGNAAQGGSGRGGGTAPATQRGGRGGGGKSGRGGGAAAAAAKTDGGNVGASTHGKGNVSAQTTATSKAPSPAPAPASAAASAGGESAG